MKELFTDLFISEGITFKAKITMSILCGVIVVAFGLYWLLKKSMLVYDKLNSIEKRAMSAETLIELEKLVEELRKVETFHKSHYAKADKIFAIIKVKMQYLKKQND